MTKIDIYRDHDNDELDDLVSTMEWAASCAYEDYWDVDNDDYANLRIVVIATVPVWRVSEEQQITAFRRIWRAYQKSTSDPVAKTTSMVSLLVEKCRRQGERWIVDLVAVYREDGTSALDMPEEIVRDRQ